MYETSGYVELFIIRTNGTSGDVDVPWTTRAHSAKDWEDYVGESAQLSFEAFQVGANHGIVFNIYIHNYVEIKEHYHAIHSNKLIKCIISAILHCI